MNKKDSQKDIQNNNELLESFLTHSDDSVSLFQAHKINGFVLCVSYDDTVDNQTRAAFFCDGHVTKTLTGLHAGIKTLHEALDISTGKGVKH